MTAFSMLRQLSFATRVTALTSRRELGRSLAIAGLESSQLFVYRVAVVTATLD
jgi:hypothetical protein